MMPTNRTVINNLQLVTVHTKISKYPHNVITRTTIDTMDVMIPGDSPHPVVMSE